MIGSISDVLTRIGAIEQQVQSLQGGTLLDSALGGRGAGSPASSSSTSSADFANQLAAAQTAGSSTVAAAQTDGTVGAAVADPTASSGTSFGSLQSSALGSATTSGLYSTSTGTSGAALPAAAAGQLTSSQQQFASTLAADTGLNPGVVSAWVLAEESGGAAQSRQAQNNNDWLNIGYTDSGTYGSSDSVWSDPTAAANATAAWLKGQDSIPGYGTASAGIQSILSTVGQPPAAQIQAIQGSGWASGGYPSLPTLYSSVSGG
jgi:hypothetical protein